MTLYEFNALSPKEKEIATVNGKFIAERYEDGQTAALYSVGDFWVEIWYDAVVNEVLFLNGFRSTERLVPYLCDIDITRL